MSSTPPRNPISNSNSGPPPLIRRNQLIASDHNEGQWPIDFPSLEMNANNNQNEFLNDFEQQLKSPVLPEQDKYNLILEPDLSDEVKQRLIKTHIFNAKLLGKEVGGTKRRKTKRRKYKKNIIKKRKTKKRKYKK
jgi:hypothetical protein